MGRELQDAVSFLNTLITKYYELVKKIEKYKKLKNHSYTIQVTADVPL